LIAARKILADNSAFITGLGNVNRIFYGDAKQGQTLPYVILAQEGISFTHTKDGNENVDYETVQVSYYAANMQDTRNLALLGKAALDRYSGVLTVDTDSSETQTVLDCTIQDQSSFPALIENRDIYTYEQVYTMIIRK